MCGPPRHRDRCCAGHPSTATANSNRRIRPARLSGRAGLSDSLRLAYPGAMPLARTLLLVPLLALAMFSFVFVRSHQGDGGVLVAAQRHAQALTPAAVARVVKTAPDPVTHAPGVRAACASLG